MNIYIYTYISNTRRQGKRRCGKYGFSIGLRVDLASLRGCGSGIVEGGFESRTSSTTLEPRIGDVGEG